jgi:hypothetical protein
MCRIIRLSFAFEHTYASNTTCLKYEIKHISEEEIQKSTTISVLNQQCYNSLSITSPTASGGEVFCVALALILGEYILQKSKYEIDPRIILGKKRKCGVMSIFPKKYSARSRSFFSGGDLGEEELRECRNTTL